MKRVTLIALLFLLSGAKAQSAPIAGAAIQDWYYDAANNVVNLRIVNQTDKAITAFVLKTRSREIRPDAKSTTCSEPIRLGMKAGALGAIIYCALRIFLRG